MGAAADGAAKRDVAAFARPVRLSCLAARHGPADADRGGLVNPTVAAHVAAHALAEEAVRRAAAARG